MSAECCEVLVVVLPNNSHLLNQRYVFLASQEDKPVKSLLSWSTIWDTMYLIKCRPQEIPLATSFSSLISKDIISMNNIFPYYSN